MVTLGNPEEVTPSSVHFISSSGSSCFCKHTKATTNEVPIQKILRKHSNFLILHLILLNMGLTKFSLSWTWKSTVKLRFLLLVMKNLTCYCIPKMERECQIFILWKDILRGAQCLITEMKQVS